MLDNEECWILKGGKGKWTWKGKYDRYSAGQVASVAFDYNYVLENEKDIVGWIHTHPHWNAYPSSTDDRTMRAWVACLGRPLLCCIIGLDGLRAFWYMNDECNGVEVKVLRIKNKVYGLNP
jgi:hypothetical protein